MNNLTLLEYGSIRVTPSSKFSVFDTIEVVGGKRNPWETWKRIGAEYPEVLTKCENFQFPGKGQRLTPVADTEGIFYIIGLLAGTVGHAYREDAAREMCKKHGVAYESIVLTVSQTSALSAEIVQASHISMQLRAIADLVDSSEAIKSDVRVIKANVSQAIADVHGSRAHIVNEIHQGNHSISEDVKNLEATIEQTLDEIKETLQAQS